MTSRNAKEAFGLCIQAATHAHGTARARQSAESAGGSNGWMDPYISALNAVQMRSSSTDNLVNPRHRADAFRPALRLDAAYRIQPLALAARAPGLPGSHLDLLDQTWTDRGAVPGPRGRSLADIEGAFAGTASSQSRKPARDGLILNTDDGSPTGITSLLSG